MAQQQQEEDLGTVQRALDRLDHGLMYRWPHIAGPVFLASAALGLTWGVHYASGTWPVVAWTPWLVTVLAAVVLLLGLESVGNLPGRRETSWAVFLWLGGTSWTAAAAWLGPFVGPSLLGLGPLMWAYVVLLAVGWPPWFRHRRVRRGVEVSAEILAWDGDAVGLPRVDLIASGAGADAHSWWARIRPQRKGEYTLQRLRQQIPRIAARYDASVSDVSVESVRDGKEGEYLLRIQTAPRAVNGAAFVIPEKRPSAREPFTVGEQSSGKPLQSELVRRGHGGVDGLAAGQKGYGKTTYARRVGLQAIMAHDALNAIADLKPGSPDYQAQGAHSWVYARTPAEVDLLVRVLLILCRVRGATKRKDRMVILFQLDESSLYYAPSVPEPAPEGMTDPDERRRYVNQAKRAAAQTDTDRQANMDRLLAISRAFDIACRVQTQRSTEARIGGAAIRSALLAGEVCGFYSPRDADAALLSDEREFALADLPRGVPGECLLMNGQHHHVTRGRLHHITEEQEEDILQRFGPGQGELQQDELDALDKELGDAWRKLSSAGRVRVVPPVTEEPTDPDAEPEQEAPARMTPDQSREHIFQALVRLGRRASVSEVAEEAGKEVTLTRSRLKELQVRGRVEVTGSNRWTRYEPVTAAPPPEHETDRD